MNFKNQVGGILLPLILVFIVVFLIGGFMVRSKIMGGGVKPINALSSLINSGSNKQIAQIPESPPQVVTSENCKDSPNYGTHSFIHSNLSLETKKYLFDAAKRTCKSFIRFDFAQTGINPSLGQFNFTQMDEMVNLATERNLVVVGTLGYSAAWITSNNQANGPIAPDKYQQFSEYLKQTVTHFPEVKYWEVWNEPDGSGFFSGTPEDYAHILSVSYGVIKQANPEAKVLFAGVTADGFLAKNGESWMDQVLSSEYETQNKFDIANVHIRGNSEDVSKTTNSIRKFYSDKLNRPDAPLWISEHGYPADQKYQTDSEFKYGEQAQLDYYKTVLPKLVENGADKIFVTLRDIASDESRACRAVSIGISVKGSGAFCSEGLVTFEYKSSTSGKDRSSMEFFQTL